MFTQMWSKKSISTKSVGKTTAKCIIMSSTVVGKSERNERHDSRSTQEATQT